MDRDLPQPREKWQGFEGGEYAIITIASGLVIHELAQDYCRFPDYAWHTESGKLLDITRADGTVSVEIVQGKCRPLHPVKTWARPLDDFLGVVSFPVGVAPGEVTAGVR